MATFELILLLLIAVLVSSVIDQLVPRVSTPLIQILLGVCIAGFSVAHPEINLDPELFLVLFIAPLLFIDAIESDKHSLWENLPSIISLAVGLVLLITLCVGFILNWLVPSIPLAAAFALGAALGPTDAVAVQSLRNDAKIGKREGAMLQGEALLNDASGVVSFQFALAAACTGAFSLLDASVTFLFTFLGGIILGVVLAGLFLFCASRVRDLGLENTTFHVLFELSMPFLVYSISELLGVSGILAVVACGIVWSMRNARRFSPRQSKLNISLASVWDVLSFILNGIVFVMLGMQLPGAMQFIWENYSIDNYVLILLVLGLTVLIVGLRFLWSIAMIRFAVNPETGTRDRLSKELVTNALITTMGGPKGAITLSIMFSIPFVLSDGSLFPQRSLLIFLASGVILCTLILATFVLPLLAPRVEEEVKESDFAFAEAKVEIFRTVIERLLHDSNPENERETRMVVSAYQRRIETISEQAEIESIPMNNLRIKVIDYQVVCLLDAAQRRLIDPYACYTYLGELALRKETLARKRDIRFSLQVMRRRLSAALQSTKNRFGEMINRDPIATDEDYVEVKIFAEEYAIQFLRTLVDNPDYPSELVAKLLIAHERIVSMLDPQIEEASTGDYLAATERLEVMQRQGLNYETEIIQEFYSSGHLSRLQAKDMRANVSLMLIDLEEHV